MTLPTKLPRWATSGLITEPSESQKDTGWPVGYRVPAQWWNWLQKTNNDWLKSIKSNLMRNWRVMEIDASMTFQAGVYCPTQNGNANKRFAFVGTVAGNRGCFTSRGAAAEASFIERTAGTAFTSGSLQAGLWNPDDEQAYFVGHYDGSDDANIASLGGTNGTSFVHINNSHAYDLNAIAQNSDGSLMIACGDDGRYVASVNQGAFNSYQFPIKTNNCFSIVFASGFGTSGRWIVGGALGGDADAIIWTSDNNGGIWTERPNPSTVTLAAMAYSASQGLVMAGGTDNGTTPTLITSTNGISWSALAVDLVGAADVADIIFVEELGLWFVLLGNNDAGARYDDMCRQLFFTDDPFGTWEVVPLPYDEYVRRIFYGDGRLFIVTITGKILVSQLF